MRSGPFSCCDCLAEGRKRREDSRQLGAIWEFPLIAFGETIMDWLVFAIVLAIPATVPATALGWFSIESALGIVWAAVFLTVAQALLGRSDS
jgi:hypothetical protein